VRAVHIAALGAIPAVLATAFAGFLLARWDGERIDAEADAGLQNRLAVVNAALQAAQTPKDQNDAWLVQLDGASTVTPLGPADTTPPILAVAQSTADVGYAEQRFDAGSSVLVGALAVPDRTGQKHNLAVVTTIDLATYDQLKSSRRTLIEIVCVITSVVVCALAFGLVVLAQRRRRPAQEPDPEPLPVPLAPPAQVRPAPALPHHHVLGTWHREPEPRRSARAARYGGAPHHHSTGATATRHGPAPP
jgi:hypothetical protein